MVVGSSSSGRQRLVYLPARLCQLAGYGRVYAFIRSSELSRHCETKHLTCHFDGAKRLRNLTILAA
jgi:hypothetical protein